MRIVFKILLFPFSLLLSVFVGITTFLVTTCAGILSILSGIVFIGALAGYSQYLFGWPVGDAGNASSLQLAIFATVLSFLLSPYGLPTFAIWFLDKLDDLNIKIKSI
jgi:hypothetical protein